MSSRHNVYLYLHHKPDEGLVEKTVPLSDRVNIDYDKDGKIIGVEVLGAYRVSKEIA